MYVPGWLLFFAALILIAIGYGLGKEQASEDAEEQKCDECEEYHSNDHKQEDDDESDHWPENE